MTVAQITLLIDSLRESSPYIKEIFSFGDCYKFHLFLKKILPECVPMINDTKTHVVTAYKGFYFDITGIVSGKFYPVTEQDLKVISEWSFQKSYQLKIAECNVCGEPFTYE